MQSGRYSSSFGIVPRLRVVFLSIALILISAILIGISQMRVLERSTNTLTTSSVPVFVRAADLERNLKNLLVLLQAVDGVQSLAKLEELDAEVSTHLRDLHLVNGGTSPNRSQDMPLNEMEQSLAELEIRAAQLFISKREFLGLKSLVAKLIQDLEKTREHTRSQLEILTFEVAATVERGSSTSGRSETGETALELLYHRNLNQANAITELTLEFEAVLNLASSLQSASQIGRVAQVERDLQFKMKTIVVLLGRLPDSEVRIQLAQSVSHLRSLIFAQDGLINQIKALIDASGDVARYEREQIAPIQAISELTRRLSQTAQSQVRNASNELGRSTNHLKIILLSTGVMAAFTILLTVVFLVERQINQRMAKLTRAVLAIASGQTDTRVDVSGNDELGRMARALEVFKTNAEELQRSNVELEKFAYVAAHDLRSPLRAIQDLSDWVIEDPDTNFSEDGREYMTLLKQRIERLNKLLADLLEYSRAGKERDDISTVSIANIVRETAGLLDPDKAYKITYSGSTAPVVTFATPLRHILLNLINNAIKHHDRPNGSIQVIADISRGRLRCMVRDDGPGIAPQYHERIFNLFQTLRPRDEVEGSGLGLAIIQKLLEHHGGTIQVQSDPELARGTTFIFDLPENSQLEHHLDKAA